MKRFIISVFACMLSLAAFSQNYTADWDSIDSRPVPEWFQDAKFGIFIHWGVYSVPSYSPAEHDGLSDVYGRYAEHYWARLRTSNKVFMDFHERVYGKNTDYRDFVKDFNAEMYEPDFWAELFKEAGAKYVVLTSKHHEGFCLWPSKYSWNWNAGDVGPHRDLLGDLTAAVRAKGLRMGYYYSLLEWDNPLYSKETLNQYIDQHMFPQMKELVETYHPDVIWPDGEWDYTSDKLRSTEFLQWLYNESSVKDEVVVNDRWGSETRSKHGGFFTSEYGLVHNAQSDGMEFTRPWEENRGIGGSYGFNRNERLEDYMSSEGLVHMLINRVARGGNFLLNIGPTADGRIPVIMQQRLRDMGAWLKVNGEAIYGTRKWDKAPAVDDKTSVFFTSKDDALYVILTEWPDKPVTIKGVKGARKLTMLGSDAKVNWSRSGDTLTIKSVSMHSPADLPCDYAWVIKIQ